MYEICAGISDGFYSYNCKVMHQEQILVTENNTSKKILYLTKLE